MPSFLQVRITRRAISPRLAMSTDLSIEDVGRGDDLREFAVERGECVVVHGFGVYRFAVGPCACMCGGGVRHDFGRKTQIGGHARGGGDAMRRGEAGDNELVHACSAQTRFEISTDESTVHVFAERWLAIARREGGFVS